MTSDFWELLRAILAAKNQKEPISQHYVQRRIKLPSLAPRRSAGARHIEAHHLIRGLVTDILSPPSRMDYCQNRVSSIHAGLESFLQTFLPHYRSLCCSTKEEFRGWYSISGTVLIGQCLCCAPMPLSLALVSRTPLLVLFMFPHYAMRFGGHETKAARVRTTTTPYTVVPQASNSRPAAKIREPMPVRCWVGTTAKGAKPSSASIVTVGEEIVTGLKATCPTILSPLTATSESVNAPAVRKVSMRP